MSFRDYEGDVVGEGTNTGGVINTGSGVNSTTDNSDKNNKPTYRVYNRYVENQGTKEQKNSTLLIAGFIVVVGAVLYFIYKKYQ